VLRLRSTFHFLSGGSNHGNEAARSASGKQAFTAIPAHRKHFRQLFKMECHLLAQDILESLTRVWFLATPASKGDWRRRSLLGTGGGTVND